jgi:hypothetical protein
MDDPRFKLWFGLAVSTIVVVVALMFYAVLSVVITINRSVAQIRESTEQSIGPVGDMTSNVATQMAQFFNPTPTILPNPVFVVQEIRALARLETIQYNIEKVITAENNQGPLGALFGDRILFVAHGYVIGGVDLRKLTSDDLWLENNALYVRLPEPEVFVATLDNDRSYVYDRTTGLLTRGNIHLESAARQAAENEIEQAAYDYGVLALAQQNAENYLESLLRSLGYPEVVYVQRPVATPTMTPTP